MTYRIVIIGAKYANTPFSLIPMCSLVAIRTQYGLFNTRYEGTMNPCWKYQFRIGKQEEPIKLILYRYNFFAPDQQMAEGQFRLQEFNQFPYKNIQKIVTLHSHPREVRGQLIIHVEYLPGLVYMGGRGSFEAKLNVEATFFLKKIDDSHQQKQHNLPKINTRVKNPFLETHQDYILATNENIDTLSNKQLIGNNKQMIGNQKKQKLGISLANRSNLFSCLDVPDREWELYADKIRLQ